MSKRPCVSMLASRRNGTLYIGVTTDLGKRGWTHKTGAVDGFTKQHAVRTLVYFEIHATMAAAIEREKRLKKWKRRWKLGLIEETHQEWEDLASLIA